MCWNSYFFTDTTFCAVLPTPFILVYIDCKKYVDGFCLSLQLYIDKISFLYKNHYHPVKIIKREQYAYHVNLHILSAPNICYQQI